MSNTKARVVISHHDRYRGDIVDVDPADAGFRLGYLTRVDLDAGAQAPASVAQQSEPARSGDGGQVSQASGRALPRAGGRSGRGKKKSTGEADAGGEGDSGGADSERPD